jgi:uncharacterized protein
MVHTLAPGRRTLSDAPRPVASGDRMDVLDILRGAAIYGILVYNIGALSGYDLITQADREALRGARVDPFAEFALEFLVQGKFYSLFSFLFGVGFAVFLQRAAARGAEAIALFKRRLLGLALIGLVHTVFIWFGDILLLYAVLGFGLIPFARRPDRFVLRWAFAMLLSPIVLYAILLGLTLVFVPTPIESSEGDPPAVLRRAVEAFAHGGYLDIIIGNVVFTAANVVRRLALMFVPRVFGMFLLGFWAGRANIFGNLHAHADLLRRVWIWGVGIGLPLSLLGTYGEGVPRLPTWLGFLEAFFESIGTPSLALGYAAGIVLLFRRDRARRLLMALAPVGRTALSNYLLQSLVGVAVFYGIGLGLFGRLGLLAGLGGATLFFALQIVLSYWWLTFAAFGPAEWVWRQFTYGRRFSLR